ncbi:MAG: hypothetical protein NC548_58070 [Lachnospiraceae bacterium]|nr:hypothetical protein [Lachnospiraceae bacterium]
MKVEYVLPDDVQMQINRIDKMLIEIEKEYVQYYLNHPFVQEVFPIQNNYNNDWRVKELEKQLVEIEKKSVRKVIVRVENEEEKKMIKERWIRNER